MSQDDFELVRGSGNVFRDMGDPVADVKQAKAILAAKIIGVLDDQKITVRKAAGTSGFAAVDFSHVRNADLGRFTLDRLIRMLTSLNGEMEVALTVRSRVAIADPSMQPKARRQQIYQSGEVLAHMISFQFYRQYRTQIFTSRHACF